MFKHNFTLQSAVLEFLNNYTTLYMISRKYSNIPTRNLDFEVENISKCSKLSFMYDHICLHTYIVLLSSFLLKFLGIEGIVLDNFGSYFGKVPSCGTCKLT